jgi:hypothetical protein
MEEFKGLLANFTILQFYNFTILQFYNFTILQFYNFQRSPFLLAWTRKTVIRKANVFQEDWPNLTPRQPMA